MMNFGLFGAGNVGSYPGRVERVRPGQLGQTLLDMRSEGDQGGAVVTVCLSVQQSGSPGAPVLRAPYATIEWGMGSGRDSVTVDYLAGQMLSVGASYLRVTASFPLASQLVVQPDGSLGPAPVEWGATDPTSDAQTLALGCIVSPGVHAQSSIGSTPRLTTFVQVPEGAPGLSAPIAIPNHAQSVTVLTPRNFVAGDLALDQNATVSYASTIAQAAVVPNVDALGAFPLARGAQFVALENSNAATPYLVALLWTIGL